MWAPQTIRWVLSAFLLTAWEGSVHFPRFCVAEDVCPEAQKWDGDKIPLVGIGVGNLPQENIPAVIDHGFRYGGYRLIDTAAASSNERILADAVDKSLNEGAIKEGGSDSDAVHIVTKIWYTHLGYERTKLAVKESLSNLLSLPSASRIRVHVLIHWPRCYDEISWMDCEGEEDRLSKEVKDAGPPPHLDKANAWKGSWKALEDLYLPEGGGEPSLKIESIGVSNFELEDMQILLDECRVKPHLYQGNVWAVVHDPFLMKLLQVNRIIFQAYNVMNGIVLKGKESPNAYRLLQLIGHDLAKQVTDEGPLQPFSAPKVVLAWLVQQDISVIPRASSLLHQYETSPHAIKKVPSLTQEQNDEVKKAVSALLKGKDLDKGEVKSTPSGKQIAYVTFVNSLSQGGISIFWLSPDTGKEVTVNEEPVKVGGEYKVHTHPGHVFVLYNEDKEKRKEFKVEADYGEHKRVVVDEL